MFRSVFANRNAEPVVNKTIIRTGINCALLNVKIIITIELMDIKIE